MKIGELVKDKTQPDIGIGLIIELHRMNPGYQGKWSGYIAIFGARGRQFVMREYYSVAKTLSQGLLLNTFFLANRISLRKSL